MHVIEIAAQENGAHRNQKGDLTMIPDGWAIIPEEMEIPASFPFVDIVVEEVTRYRDVERLTEVTRTREEQVMDEEGSLTTVTVEYTDYEPVTEQEPYTRLEVTEMTGREVPEPEPPLDDEGEDTAVWDELDRAYQEGVNTAYDQ